MVGFIGTQGRMIVVEVWRTKVGPCIEEKEVKFMIYLDIFSSIVRF